MTEDEVNAVAAELAKAGGVSWYPGRERGPLKVVADRYRDRARLAIAALERHRAGKQLAIPSENTQSSPPELGTFAAPQPLADDAPRIGSTVLYRPPGDKRAYPYRIEKIDGDRAYLVPNSPLDNVWIDIKVLLPPAQVE